MNQKISWLLLLSLTWLLPSCMDKGEAEADTIPPSMTIHPNFDWQGHRGARGLAPENTVPGFLKALEYPVNTLELDLAVSADTQLIVSHEPWMSGAICSMPGGDPVPKAEERDHALYRMSAAEIREYDCGTRGHAGFPQQEPLAAHKPTLREVVEAVRTYCETYERPAPRYNIEIKSEPEWDGSLAPGPEAFVSLVLRELEQLGIRDSSCVQSFDFRVLKVLHRRAPGITTAALVSNTKGLQRNLEELGYTPKVYSPNFRLVSAGLVDSAHARGMRVVPWTVNEAAQMETLIDMGVDGIITDYPNLILEWER